MLDIDIPPLVLDRPEVTAPGSVCDQVCAATPGAFDGSELLADVLGVPAAAPAVMAARWQPIPAVEACARRGCAVINEAGRLGITLGHGMVIEPIGRIYALTTDPPTRWVAGYRLPGVTYTVNP